MDVNLIGKKHKVFGRERGRLIIVFIYYLLLSIFNIYKFSYLVLTKHRTHTEKSHRQVSMVPQPFIFPQTQETKDTTTTTEVERLNTPPLLRKLKVVGLGCCTILHIFNAK